jgi:hypothetical protein
MPRVEGKAHYTSFPGPTTTKSCDGACFAGILRPGTFTHDPSPRYPPKPDDHNSTAAASLPSGPSTKVDWRALHWWQTRLLRLSPGREDEPIHAELVVVDLVVIEGVVDTKAQAIVHYDALSYTWGPQDHGQTVWLDGNPLHTTKYLHAALSALRTRCVDCLWVDAICINQADATEKSIKVAKMFTIFQKARRVHVW